MKYESGLAEVSPPTYDHFDVLKEAFLEVAGEPDAKVKNYFDYGLWVKVDRFYADLDLWAWPPMGICVTGLVKTIAEGNTLAIRYRELPYHDETINSSVNHDYVIITEGEEVIKSVHSIRGCPALPSVAVDLTMNGEYLAQVSEGDLILQQELGPGLQLTAGDCGVLFDRLMFIAS